MSRHPCAKTGHDLGSKVTIGPYAGTYPCKRCGGHLDYAPVRNVLMRSDMKDFVKLGIVSRLLDRQTQYVSRYIDGSFGNPNLGGGLRFIVCTENYHETLIHRDDVDEFVRRIKEATTETNPSNVCRLCGLGGCYYVMEYGENCCICRRVLDVCLTCDLVIAKKIGEEEDIMSNPNSHFIGYRYGSKGKEGVGTFYFRPQMMKSREFEDRIPRLSGGNKVIIKRFDLQFENPYIVPERDIKDSPIPPPLRLFRKWFPSMSVSDVSKIAKKRKIRSWILMEQMVAMEARRRGHDAIIYGNQEIQDVSEL